MRLPDPEEHPLLTPAELLPFWPGGIWAFRWSWTWRRTTPPCCNPAGKRDVCDRWMRSCEIVQSQVAHSPNFLLQDVTVERNIDPMEFHDNWRGKLIGSSTGGVYLCDYNHDGYSNLEKYLNDLTRNSLLK